MELMAVLFNSQSTLLYEFFHKNTITRLFFEIDGLFDGNEISKLLHTISLQTQRRVNISIHCNADR